MDKDKIRFCLKLAGILLVVFALCLALLLAVALFEINNIYIVIISATISMAVGFVGVALFIFGFLLPILGQYMYHNIMPEYAKEHYRNSAVWRFILNLPR